MMRRRDVIAAIGVVAVIAPGVARAQLSPKRPLVGVLGGATAAVGMTNGTVGGYRQGLGELGYVEGQNLDVA
jgi:hypothetical protein